MTLECHEVMAQLWDYIDGELPPERMRTLREHIAMCKRCDPQFRFELAFLEAVARQRARLPRPSGALVDRLRALVTA